MKQVLIYIFMFSFCFGLTAQTKTENYIKVTTYRAPSTEGITENDTLVTVTYFDGLGRPKQIVNVRAGGQGQDIVTPMVYDPFGRQTKEYLSYAIATQGGVIQPDPVSEAEAYFNTKYPGTVNPYSEKILENSPLGRVMKQGAPGTPWQADPASDNDQSIKYKYDTNVTGEVRLYKVQTTADNYSPGLSTYVPTLQESGFYLGGRLHKTITKDENWQPGDGNLHTTEEFKDFQGRVVLKRTYADLPGQPQAPHSTYYVYDIYGNLSYVIPPKVDTSDSVSLEELNELCYQYVYDHLNRLVEKKLPGKGWEYIVYNKGNYPVFTQDQNLASQGKWLFTKYDHFGRALYTGLFNSPDSREDMQIALQSHTPIYESRTETPNLIDVTDVYYTNDAFPNTGLELSTIHYYDRYDFDIAGGTSENTYGITPTTKTMTLATGSKTRILDTNQWITTVMYYDKKARPIYTYIRNDYLNTTEKIKNKVNFVGEVLETTTEHIKDGQASITTIEKFTYDHIGRLLKHTHQMAGQPEEILAENIYDELGQLVQKKTGNTSVAPLQTLDYSYNIRGWLTKINDVGNIGNDLFSFDIRYNDPTTGTPLYNGNISQTRWRTANTDNSLKHYNYSYDALNRITQAIDNSGNYNLNSAAYDKNGNILSLNRQGHINEAAINFGVMDNLIYSYDTGNKLQKVEDIENDSFGFKDDAIATVDNEDDYTYDINGNMLSDTNKGITSISYNHLNLPTEIVFNNDQSQKISYFYSADGVKQQKVVNDGGVLTTTDYVGTYTYENGSLKFINHAEGYIEPDGAGGYDYVYQYKDHLGNIRLSYSDTNDDGSVDASEITDEKDYYPFGLAHRGYNDQIQGTYYPYGYNGKEEQNELSLAWYDFGARNYDAALGRWMNIDPIANAYYSKSPYNYALNNPIVMVDPDGARVYFVIYTGGSSDAHDAAKTRKREIENSDDFNSEEDVVYFLKAPDLGKLKDQVAEKIKDAEKNGFGKTVEASFFGHGGADGPVGSVKASSDSLSDVTGVAIDGSQLSPSGWKSIDFNFDESGSIACFYSCEGASFAEKFLNYTNATNTAGTTGKAGGSYTNEGDFSAAWFPLGRKVYMVSQENGQVNPTFAFSADSPVATYKTQNGNTVKISYYDDEGNKIYEKATHTEVNGNATIDNNTKQVKSGSNN